MEQSLLAQVTPPLEYIIGKIIITKVSTLFILHGLRYEETLTLLLRAPSMPLTNTNNAEDKATERFRWMKL